MGFQISKYAAASHHISMPLCLYWLMVPSNIYLHISPNILIICFLQCLEIYLSRAICSRLYLEYKNNECDILRVSRISFPLDRNIYFPSVLMGGMCLYWESILLCMWISHLIRWRVCCSPTSIAFVLVQISSPALKAVIQHCGALSARPSCILFSNAIAVQML